MLKHQLGLAALALAVLTFPEAEARAAALPRIDLQHPNGTTVVRGGHGGFGGGFGHFGGGFGHFGGSGFRHFGFAPRHAFIHPFHRRVFVHRFPRRVVFVRRFPRVAFFRRFPRRAFFVGAPIYAYGGGCVVALPRGRDRKSILVAALPLVPRLVKNGLGQLAPAPPRKGSSICRRHPERDLTSRAAPCRLAARMMHWAPERVSARTLMKLPEPSLRWSTAAVGDRRFDQDHGLAGAHKNWPPDSLLA